MFSAASLVGMGASSAAGQQISDAAAAASKLAKKMYKEGKGYLDPFAQSGTEANRLYGTALGVYGRPAQSEFYSNFQTDPGFESALKRAMDITTRRYALMGRTGGSMPNALLRTGQEAMNTEYGKRLDRLAGLSGSGQSAASNIAGLGAGYANSSGNFMMQGAQGRAEGIMGRANASIAGLNAGENWNKFRQGLNSGYTVNRAF